jgi:lariat debranching enzyme
MHDFHEYYAGTRVAPYLTIFIGGNHEASNYMWEMYYGGWAAPRIYYMGAANVVRLGPLRIAGLSGIWKGYNYKKPHYERLPYNGDDVKSIYHVRELDVRKLLQIRSQVDIGLSHDWPRGMEWKGDHRTLFRWKPDFEQEAKDGTLGSVAARTVLERLRPPHWFSAHMHCKFAGIWNHAGTQDDSDALAREEGDSVAVKNAGEISLDLPEDEHAPVPKNTAEIDLDLDDIDSPQPPTSYATGFVADVVEDNHTQVSQGLRDLLPESFAKPNSKQIPTLPFPPDITNRTTRFLALDKCMPKRSFLQLLEVEPHTSEALQRPLRLEYDKEWLAITRVFADNLQLGDPNAQVPSDQGDVYYRPLIEKEMAWVEDNVVATGKMEIPEDFAQTAPIYNPEQGIHVSEQPQEHTNLHTRAFCDLLQIPNHFEASEEERAQRIQAGPRPEQARSNRGGGGRGGHRGGGRGHNRGRGHGGGRGRGRGRGRW